MILVIVEDLYKFPSHGIFTGLANLEAELGELLLGRR